MSEDSNKITNLNLAEVQDKIEYEFGNDRGPEILPPDPEEEKKKQLMKAVMLNRMPEQRKRSKHSIAKVLKYYQSGLQIKEIKALMGCGEVFINKVITDFGNLIDYETVSNFKGIRNAALEQAEYNMLRLLADPIRQQTASLADVGRVFKTIHSSRRLEAGESSINVATKQTIQINLSKLESED